MDEYLFSYGTLQDEAVQLATFGRRLFGEPEALEGFRIDRLMIEDEEVIAASGLRYHLIISASGRAEDAVTGTGFIVTHAELLQADAYEVDDYQRVRVGLKSGRQAWAYIRKDD
jgi:Gamma-glutamyl cyclotransferase, AIG2-like